MKLLLLFVSVSYCGGQILDAFSKELGAQAAKETCKLADEIAKAAAPHIKKGANEIGKTVSYYKSQPDPSGAMGRDALGKVNSWILPKK